MIEAFSIASAHLYQDALASQARLRFEVFVRRRGLDHSSWEGLEFDEFDTPAAIYLVWRDVDRVVRGVARLLPTTRPYMMQSYWPHLVEDGDLPSGPGLFEVTRVCVDKTVPPNTRKTIFPELLCAIEEFIASRNGIGMIGVTREHLLAHFIQTGICWLGPADEIEGEMERAFFVPTHFIRPSMHCQKFGIVSPVLLSAFDGVLARRAA
ncbi:MULTISPECIES: acyl-homoserine-lactone synthase [Bradyrhizobium]|uniref:acyl-homoserine-lactone synthase n=1 Tax=Bradyrhizobium TaxID=374 RepID=UPI000685A137|nr:MULTISPECIES: acyl-homoserine-lactone synthase [Bradyrhizobium]UFW51118.1 GNAT family N-acetyltransferase [Bradyrhizobium arachidis]